MTLKSFKTIGINWKKCKKRVDFFYLLSKVSSMKTLSNYVIRVRSQKELDVALKFFRRASRRPMHFASDTVLRGDQLYVGMHRSRTVMAAGLRYPHEIVVPFDRMSILADTPSREAALKASGWKPRGDVVIQFDYPKRDSFGKTTRAVQLIAADDRYYIGLEITADGHKFKKFLKAKATNVSVLEYNQKTN